MNGRKRVPDDIEHGLTPFAIAVWMADDGCAADNSFILNTQSFGHDEQEKLLECLARRYGVSGTINRDRRNYRLRFNRSNTDRLRSLVQPFAIPTLNKKLVPVTTASRVKR